MTNQNQSGSIYLVIAARAKAIIAHSTLMRLLSSRAETIAPRRTTTEFTLITEADKLKSLEKFGLNLDGCKITPEQKSILIDVLFQYREVFNTESPPLNPFPGFKYSIPLIDNEPVFTRQYRMRLDVNSLLQEHVEKLLKDGILERSFSCNNSPVLLVKKSTKHETI